MTLRLEMIDDKRKENVYYDEMTGNTIKKKYGYVNFQDSCVICDKRKRAIKRLDKIGKEEGEYVKERRRTNLYTWEGKNLKLLEEGEVEKLNDCPNCKNYTNDIAVADNRQKGHIHVCISCKTKWPKEDQECYVGDFVDSSLEERG